MGIIWNNALKEKLQLYPMAEITLAVAALAGLGSFVAPCILPMIPAFLAYISGTTLSELNQNGSKTISVNRTNIILNSIFLF